MTDETRLRFYVDDSVIYQYYFGDFDLKSKYHSPLRKDPTPSFMFKNIGTSNIPRIIWNDFGADEIKHKDAIGFVMALEHLSRKEAVALIWKELVVPEKVSITPPKLVMPIKLPYEYRDDEIQDFEMEFWDKFWIGRDLLDFYNVRSLRRLSRMGKKLWGSEPGDPAFIYVFEPKKKFKTYRPYDKLNKFRGSDNGDVIEGYDQLPQCGDHLFITSSLKDTMTLRRCGFLACNPTSENSKKALYPKVRELNQRFGNVRILFDNDTPGMVSAMNLSKITGWEAVMIPPQFPKDPSDIVKNTGNYFLLSEFFSKFDLSKYHI